MALPFAGCLENGSVNNGATAIASKVATSTSGNFPVAISQVVFSNTNPTTTIELIGSGNQISQFCATAADCQCQFSFIDSNGVAQQRFQTLSYVEQNLARCLYTQVSTNAGFYDVSLFVTSSSSTVSNSNRVFVTALNPSLDPSVANNYVFVNRFMCRDVITKARSATNFYGQNLQDPNAWLLNQAYNFYSTSLGLDYGAHAVTVGQSVQATPGFECPPVPNDSSFDPAINYSVFSLAAVNFSDFGGTNLTDNTIFPNTDQVGVDANCTTGNEARCEKYLINRHDYYLAAFQDGTFKQAVCTPHTPANLINPTLQCSTSTVSSPITLSKAQATTSGADIVGFAAMPDSNEACPSAAAVTIPSGKKWAKLWRFRASLQQRTLQMATNPGQVGALVCTTRNQECISDNVTVGANTTTSVCWGDAASAIFPKPSGGGPHIGTQQMVISGGTSFGNCDPTGTIGDNWAPTGGASYKNGGGSCSDSSLSTWLLNTGNKNCCGDSGDDSAALFGAANYTAGGSFCTPTLRGQVNAAALGGLAEDVWLISNQQRGCVEADTDASGKLLINGFLGADPYLYSSLSVDSSSLFDFLYVVTPASVHISDMTDPSSTTAQKFTPFRKDRNGNNINYGLSLGSENTASALERQVQFPICVLQDTK